jgi:predicted nucleic acid-binding protein
MIALDTNLLVFAHRFSVPQHAEARRALERAAADPDGWGFSLGTVTEFWSVVTHPASPHPSAPEKARAFLEVLVRDAGAHVFSPGPGFSGRLTALAARLGVRGVRIFDLQIGLAAVEAGASQLWTHDRGFVACPGLEVRRPF